MAHCLPTLAIAKNRGDAQLHAERASLSLSLTHCLLPEPHDGTQPWFISKPRSVTASLGQSVLISCAIAGDPFPTVHWLRDGKALSKDHGHFELLQNEDVFTLVLKNVQPWHAGQYEILLK